MKEILARPVVSVIAINENNNYASILMQRRTKSKNMDKYQGFWELPQGKIRTGESIFSVARRELHEETGLDAVSLDKFHDAEEKTSGTGIEAFRPLICVFDLVSNYIGLAVVIRTRGNPIKTKEASEHKWMSENEITDLIEDNNVFPLNIPMIKKFFELDWK